MKKIENEAKDIKQLAIDKIKEVGGLEEAQEAEEQDKELEMMEEMGDYSLRTYVDEILEKADQEEKDRQSDERDLRRMIIE